MTKDEARASVIGAISMALKDPTLQQGFEIICKENAELRAIAENQQSSNMSRYFENKKLKEGLAVGSILNKGLISMNKALEEERDKYRNMVFDKDDQLTEAKEIIKQFLNDYPVITKELLDKLEQFVKETKE